MNDIASSPRRYPLSSGLDWLVGDFKIDGVKRLFTTCITGWGETDESHA